MSKIRQAVSKLHKMDQLSARDQWVNRIHPLVKLLLTFFYLILLLSMGKYQLSGVLLLTVYPLVGFSLSELKYRECIWRFRLVLPLIFFMGLFNPFFDREIIVYWGSVPVTGGMLSMATLYLKGILALSAGYLLIATTSVMDICMALRMLSVPQIFVTMMLLIYRYLTVLFEEAELMSQAYMLRAPGQKGIHYSAWGSFAGQLLLRSMDRAERVYESMCLRGYQGEFQTEKIRENLKKSQAISRETGEFFLEVKNLHFSYHPEKETLSEVSLKAEEGECIGLIGGNGMGKSTFLKVLVGLLEYSEGEAHICGIPLKKENYREIRRLIGYVFQDSDSQLFMPTVYEDVMFGPKNYGYDKEEVKERTEAALSMVHLEGFEKRRIYELSGGEKKLVSIATVLALSPKIILMDEPTVALDPKNRKNFMGILKELPGLKIIASHDLDMVGQCCDRVILLEQGKIAADGPVNEILQDKKLLEEHGLI